MFFSKTPTKSNIYVVKPSNAPANKIRDKILDAISAIERLVYGTPKPKLVAVPVPKDAKD